MSVQDTCRSQRHWTQPDKKTSVTAQTSEHTLLSSGRQGSTHICDVRVAILSVHPEKEYFSLKSE